MSKVKESGGRADQAPGPEANSADDSYVWIAGSGAWSDAGNWKDVTTGTKPATTPPGSDDSATINGPGGFSFEIISGPGTTTALTLTGNEVLDGQFGFDSLVQADTLIIDAGSGVSAVSAILGSRAPALGTTEVSGATFEVGGTLAVDETLVVLNAGMVQADSVTMRSGFPRVDNTSVFEVGTVGTAASGALTVDPGAVLSGNGIIQARVIDNGTIVADTVSNRILIDDDVSGNGTLQIGKLSEIDVFAAINGGVDILFPSSAGTLRIEPALNQDETISGFSNGDVINLVNTPANAVSYAAGDKGIGTLTVTNNGTQVAALKLAGDYTDQPFFVLPDAGGGTNIVVVCFCKGTRIRTPAGEMPVEQLAVGDRVLTVHDEARPIVWIGKGRVAAPREGRATSEVVIVRKDALDDNVPCRDLRVTKGHSLYVDGVLIPVEFLINHRSIVWDEEASEETVYHVELATHDVLIANGAPAESYRDDGNRRLLENTHSRWNKLPMEPCARVLTSGPAVDSIWRRLRDRTNATPGLLMTRDPDLHLIVDGRRIDALDRNRKRYVFPIGTRPRTVRIRSRSAAPQALGVSRDPRVLGVAIQRIVLAYARRHRAIAANAASLSNGYHVFEEDFGARWTDGDAEVPASLFAGMNSPALLMLHLGVTTLYPDGAAGLSDPCGVVPGMNNDIGRAKIAPPA